jgi:murein DD-endopeptidase MepM/ murein hydrolase activator NlpD
MDSVSGPLRRNSTWRELALLLAAWFCVGVASAEVTLDGDLIQGGILTGTGARGAQVWQDDEAVRVSDAGVFLLGFGRDAPLISSLRIVHADGSEEHRTLKIAKREYRIQRIDGLPKRKVTPRSKEDLKRIRDDTIQLKKARARNDAREDFLSGFMWPVEGPISGVYGSQRILNGKPRRPHFGVDIARPTGTTVVAPADGVITLAHPDMFFSGGTLLIDHGHKLSSAFLHLSRILVEVGQKVKKGEPVAEIGATGRVTGAHLDWRMNLRDHRIDPQLLVPPMSLAEK